MSKKNNREIHGSIPVIISIISDVISIIVYLNNHPKIAALIIIVSVICIGYYLYKTVSNFLNSYKAISLYADKTLSKFVLLNSDFHHILHSIRDIEFNIKTSQLLNMEYFESFNINLCNKIESMLTTLFNKPTCACIKTINIDDLYNTDYNQWKISTFVRGDNAQKSKESIENRTRNDGNPILINENSDFKIIVKGYVDFYTCPNMDNIREKFLQSYNVEYCNSRKDFQNYYNSTIVVPIRIQTKYLKNREKSNCGSIHLLGFLCIDTFETFNDSQELLLFKIGTEYTKALADSMYSCFDTYFAKYTELQNNKSIYAKEEQNA